MGLNALLDQQDACTKIRTKITAEFPARNKILRIFCIFPTQRILANSDTSILMNHQIPEPYVTPEEAADFLRTNRLKVIRMARSGLLPAHPLGSTKGGNGVSNFQSLISTCRVV